jgi:hypothetical protein
MPAYPLQISYTRLLVGDDSRTAPTYTDAQIRQSITIGPTRPALPLALRMCGLLCFRKFPVAEPGS